MRSHRLHVVLHKQQVLCDIVHSRVQQVLYCRREIDRVGGVVHHSEVSNALVSDRLRGRGSVGGVGDLIDVVEQDGVVVADVFSFCVSIMYLYFMY